MSGPDLGRLLDRLVADATPVRRLRPPRVRLVAWLAVVTALAAGVLWSAAGARTVGGGFVAEVTALAAASVLMALAALRSMVPGLGSRVPAIGAVVAVGVAALVLLLAVPIDTAGSLEAFLGGARGCAAKACLLGLLPWVVLLVAAWRAAPLRPRASAALVAAAAWLAALAILRVLCPAEELLHVIAGHGTAALGAAVVAWAAGAVVLRVPRAPSV